MGNKKGSITFGIILLAMVFCMPGYQDVASYVWKTASSPVVVVDPGHGGIDGGAESRDGSVEKKINLKIAKELKRQLEAEGIRVVLTRETDEGLYDKSQEGAIRSLKTQDMYERKHIIEEVQADLTISIHLNSFTQDPSVKGAQVFYPSDGAEKLVSRSREAAQIIQKELNETINTDEPRTEMEKNDVFLLKDISCPIVIVECGFLSNPEDAMHLKDKKHQLKIAKSLKASICKCLGN